VEGYSVVTGWGEDKRGSEDREKSGLEGPERVVGRENNGLLYRRKRESEEGENRDKRIVMMEWVNRNKKRKRKKKKWNKKHQVQVPQKVQSITKICGIIPEVSNPGSGVQAEALMWPQQVPGFWVVFGPSVYKITWSCEVR
jgi:hypothetical protein